MRSVEDLDQDEGNREEGRSKMYFRQFTECIEDLIVSIDRKSKKTRITPWLKKCFRICS